jgi:hypothetical protein
MDLTESDKLQSNIYQKTIKELATTRSKMPSIIKSRKAVKLVYTRYADDFILLVNSKKEFALEVKQQLESWFKENLKFNLSPTKTVIPNFSVKRAKFLGFSIRTYRKRKFSLSKFGDLSKTAGWNIVIDVDLDRVNERFYLKGFLNIKGKPVAKRPWTGLRPEEIINRYNAIIRGITNYSFPVFDRLSNLNSIFYVLKFSCMGTFAKKFHSKITQSTERFGDPLTITVNEKQEFLTLEKGAIITNRTFRLLTYVEMKKIKQYKKFDWKSQYPISMATPDVFKPMNSINWRT